MENDPNYPDLPLRRLIINGNQGVMNFGRLENKVHYNLDNPTDNLTNEMCPARYSLTPDLRLDSDELSYSLSVWVWRYVPEKFKEPVFFHELKEAECVFIDKMDRHSAHKRANAYHIVYAKNFFDERSFKEFINWQGQFKCYQLRPGK